MNATEVNAYIGRPYRLGADGPDEFDCRGLVCDVLRRHFGRDVPSLPVGPELAALWAQRMGAGVWETVDAPVHGDAVVMRGGSDPHVGVYLDSAGPGVLHAYVAAGQVVWTPLDRLRVMGFGRLSYVRCHAVAPSAPG